ncbi:MAG: hypothetical protein M3446_01820 [Actinomycetota bacterium]|nr:hypothetical protein [Actinomycetota bacterium]
MISVWSAAEDIGKAGPVGLFLIVSLLIVVFFLARSMRTHLRRVPFEFPDTTSSAGPPDPAEPAAPDDRVIEGEIVDRPEDPRNSAESGPRRPDTPRSGLG